MSDIVILGAGVSGHTAALHLSRLLPEGHTITVVSPNADWNWIPSNIWVGVGRMDKKKVLFPLGPVYRKKGIRFEQARATALWPEGDEADSRPAVDIVCTDKARSGEQKRIRYDYLINATGPQLRFDLTKGLGPEGGHSLSVCTAEHAVAAAQGLADTIRELKKGNPQTLIVGTGHGTCTCEGAAFEYAFNVEHELRAAGVRDKARLIYLTNEPELGDFGVGGMVFKQEGYETTSKIWTESLFRERGVEAITGAHVHEVKDGVVHFETLDGTFHDLEFNFAMLLPPFGGVPLTAHAPDGSDISERLFAPNGFMKVDADYSKKPYSEWKASDWPETCLAAAYDNIWAVGIAFAPPHQISEPRTTPNGTLIAPAPPRTGQPSGEMGKAAALSIVERITKGPDAKLHTASMARLGSACVASAGTGLTTGSAASMVMMPIVPDKDKYPSGRDLRYTTGEIGLSGHWTKLLLHYMFIYKAKGLPGWQFIPE
ncbi:Pyridine nucleotide-disulfide oxidoreductase [Corynebacterium kalinowskii]|uniref:Pyridine nucleotide-disulfide oxidoreductase n=1 Tax=Corynebacterium kalinowskii TaxID=2675216 RepID=A0A6B8VYU4_9CORY|nr:FAD/NAD(P)-binding oxidoreductase [Corynebacterium kalinowskii]QGU02490.1 Pyridine nucleotide-disulfide oxidoreductase [Corynebacterium kalinowskii]